MKRLCKNATLKLLHNEFPAVQLITKEAQRFCREHSSQQIPGTLHMQKKIATSSSTLASAITPLAPRELTLVDIAGIEECVYPAVN